MSLTLALSEREQNLLTHANLIGFLKKSNSEVVSNIRIIYLKASCNKK